MFWTGRNALDKPKVDGATGLTWRPRANHWVATWVAPADLVKRGYRPRTQRLWPPVVAPLSPFTDDVATYLRSECDRLHTQARAWGHGDQPDPALLFDGTMAGLVRCYLEDPDS